ncbi:MAG: GNAT family N-acetyltransferase [Myxococcaceae bacterium]|nr:GNAT family N-acetyltransferase [Myxococcaceae bacterium]
MRVEVIRELSKLSGVKPRALDGLRAFFGHNEPYVIAAVDEGRVTGWLPLVRHVDAPLGLKATRWVRASDVHGQVDDDSARPLLDFLLRNEKLSMLELGGETATGPLARAAAKLASFRCGVQLSPGPLRASVPLGRDLGTWFHSLGGWAASLVRRTRSLLSTGELELVTAKGAGAGRALLTMYLELEARSQKLDSATGVGGDPRRAARHARLADDGATLFHFLLLDGLPIAATLSVQVDDRIVQLEGVRDMSFEDTAPEEVLLMLEVGDAVKRRCAALELCADLVRRHERLGAIASETARVQLYRRFAPHHLAAVWSQLFRREAARAAMPPGPMRSDLARQLRARTHAAETFDRLDHAGVTIERTWGDALRRTLPFEVYVPEYERVRRAV